MIKNLLACTDPQQWCPDWKLEMNNPYISFDFSKSERENGMAACFLWESTLREKNQQGCRRNESRRPSKGEFLPQSMCSAKQS